ncbi:MAG: hypothetical protein QOH79_1141 [Acidimicrobiaceae bacterium]
MGRAEPLAGQPRDRSGEDDVRPFSTFANHARVTLGVLAEHFAFERWMINRVVGDELVVEYCEPPDAPPPNFAWADTICAVMAEGRGPGIALSVEAVPDYASTPQCRRLGIGAYAGTVLHDASGRLWGTLCATHPTALDLQPTLDEAFLRWVSRSLAIHLGATSSSVAPGARRQPSTILDTESWNTMLDKEYERSARTSQPACVIELEVTAATPAQLSDGDLLALVDHATQILAVAARGCDFVGRVGPDRLCVLAVNCPPENGETVVRRLVAELEENGVAATAAIIGLLPRAQLLDKNAEPPGVITYIPCGLCDRKGAYISSRFPVLRCKYCGGRHPLSDQEWRDALSGVGTPE